MEIELNERQLKAMEYIIKNGSISIKEYLKLIPEKSRELLKGIYQTLLKENW
jgi:hypothetical protein